jgi:hypothetical protein
LRRSIACRAPEWNAAWNSSTLVPELRDHLTRYAEPSRRGLVFVGRKGGKVRRSNFNLIWSKAWTWAGVPSAHFHDYADTCVMPMSGRSACSAVVSGLKVSA